MTLFSSQLGQLNDRDVAAARALSDVATIGILQARLIEQGDVLAGQLQQALNTRVLIEQAKGAMSGMYEIDLDNAFKVLRTYARANGQPLRSVARSVLDRTLDLSRHVDKLTSERQADRA